MWGCLRDGSGGGRRGGWSNVSVTEPFRGAQGVRTEAPQINAGSQRVFSQDAMVDGPVSKRPVGVPLPHRVFEWPEERPVRVARVSGSFQVIVDPLQGQRMSGHVADFAAFAENPQADHTLAGLEVAYAQATELFATQPVVKKGGQSGRSILASAHPGAAQKSAGSPHCGFGRWH
jgi:hypothetical protein